MNVGEKCEKYEPPNIQQPMYVSVHHLLGFFVLFGGMGGHWLNHEGLVSEWVKDDYVEEVSHLKLEAKYFQLGGPPADNDDDNDDDDNDDDDNDGFWCDCNAAGKLAPPRPSPPTSVT